MVAEGGGRQRSVRRAARRLVQIPVKIIAVELFNPIDRPGGQIVCDHQLCKQIPVHQDDLGCVLLLGIGDGFPGELRRGDEEPLAGALPGQRPYELLYFRPSDRRCSIPALGLNIDQAESQLCLLYTSPSPRD